MRYRYQFLLELYNKRRCHPNNKIWIYQHKQVIQEKHYEKLYLYQRTKQQLDAVTFQIQYEGTILSYHVTQFHQLKRSFLPYLRGCLIELPEEVVQSDYTISIQQYVLDGTTYDYVKDCIEINLEKEQTDSGLSSLLHMNDITMYPLITDSYYICACGHLNPINEECENCHRSIEDNQQILKKGIASLSKEGFLKRYLNSSTYRKCGNNPTAYLAYLQNTAARFSIQIEEKDIQDIVDTEKKRHRSTILWISAISIFLSFSLIALMITLPDSTPSTPIKDDLYSSSQTPDFTDDDQTYKYTICEGSTEGYQMNIILEGYGDDIESLIIQVVMTSEDLGMDINDIDDTAKDIFKMAILDQFQLTGNEEGIEANINTYDNELYCEIYLDVTSIANETLDQLGLSMLKYYSYDLAVLEFQTQEDMYCY